MERGPGLVIITGGSKGATAYSRGGAVTLDSLKVDVVDTVGAGDTFKAGVLASLHDQGLVTKAAIGLLSQEAIRADARHEGRRCHRRARGGQSAVAA